MRLARLTNMLAAGMGAVLLSAAAHAASLQLESPQFRDGGTVPPAQIYGACGGDNISPALQWTGVPPGTKALAVTLFDPDAGGAGWWHWIVFNVPPATASLPTGSGGRGGTGLPEGAIQGTNDFGNVGYGGPCPPAGNRPHRYRLTLWALDAAKAPFGSAATGKTVQPWLTRHALNKAVITARYGR